MSTFVVETWNRVLDLIAPLECASCNSPRGPGAFCNLCSSQIEPRCELTWDTRVPGGLHTGGDYAGPAGLAVRQLKYQGRSDLAAPLGRWLVDSALPTPAVPADLVVPVPLHRRRLADRGYNQSALVANQIGRCLGVPSLPRALTRSRDTPAQASMSRAERLANLDGAITERVPNTLRGHRTVLVDDVVTTGATARECVRAITEAGGHVSLVLALTRADSHNPGR